MRALVPALCCLDVCLLAAAAACARGTPTWHVWRDGRFYFADSVLDLLAGAAVRCALVCALLALAARVHAPPKPRRSGGPLATPLIDASADDVDADGHGPARLAARRASRLLLGSRVVLLGITAAYLVCKCLTRLVAGPPAEPSERSREVVFWAAVGATLALSVAEHSALARVWLDQPIASGEAADAPAAADATGTPARSARVRDVLALCATDWPLFIQAFCGLSVAAAGESAIPYLYGEILNEIALSENPTAFHRPMALLVLTAGVTGLATGVRGATFTILGARFSTRMRQRLLDALLRAEMGFFDSVKTGDISSRLAADCQKVGDQVELNVNVFVRSLLQVVLTTAAMFAINARLGAVAFVSVPPIVVASRVFGTFIRKLVKDYQKALADSTAVAEEALGSMRTVRAFAAEAEVSAAYQRDMRKYRRLVYREAGAYFWYSSLTFTFLPYCSACLVLFYGAQLVQSGGMRPGQLVSFVFYLQALQGSFNSLASIYTGLTQAVGAADKVFEWIEREPRVSPRGALMHGSAQHASGELRLDSVHFSYPARPGVRVLRGLSLEVKPGQVVALCGTSGGGKSSVLALLQRWYDPEPPPADAAAANGSAGSGARPSGTVTLDGRDVREFDSVWYHTNVSIVSQEPTLFSRSIRDNVRLGLLPPSADGAAPADDARPVVGDAEVEQACREANAHEFISTFPNGYDTDVGERGVQLSGGQKQRIAIARALVRRPRVLFLDEATSALDAESEALVQSAIDQMILNSGGRMTVVVIAHRLSTIRSASQIAVVSGGTVVELGTHDELLARDGAYAQLVRMQLQGPPDTLRSTSRESAGGAA